MRIHIYDICVGEIMDFQDLLRAARKNELNKKEPVKCLQTKFKPPNKEKHEKDKLLSEGVQRFLARKEEEEKRKQMEAERRKNELMALRAKDPKANKRIQTMLKRTKSANKSVMEDAVDNNNTADTLAGPSQPDEDDYGFVSETSSQLYNKLIQKMYSTPSDDLPKFAPSKKPSGANLSNTKERVKMALLKQEEEDKLPHKRKRKGKEKKEDEDDDALDCNAPDKDLSKCSSEPNKDKTEKPKVKRPMPPPVDFHELLKIAEQKQHEPIVFEPKIKKPQEPEVLMTKKQKIEYEKMQEWKRQRERRLQGLESGDKSSSSNEDKKPISKIPRTNQANSEQKSANATSQRKNNAHDDRLNNVKGVKSLVKNEKNAIPNKSRDSNDKYQRAKPGSSDRKTSNQPSIENKFRDDETSRLIKERDEALRILKEKEKLIRERDEAVRKLREKEQLIRERDEAVRKLKLLEESSAKSSGNPVSKVKLGSQKLGVGKAISKNPENSKSGSSKSSAESFNAKSNSTINKNNLQKGGLKSEGKGVSREFPPRPMKPLGKPVSREEAVRNLQRSKQFPPADVRRKALAVKRRRIESDDEYDSELDDFIDDNDNDMGSEEVSKVISEIFKYDKNKYSWNDDADDECMESNFAQISKEEFFSTKCGILEDLEDIRRDKAKLAKRQKR